MKLCNGKMMVSKKASLYDKTRRTIIGIFFIGLLLYCAEGHGGTDPSPDDLTSLSLEDLMNISVTSVSRRPQKLSDAAAAIFVITQEDIHRSGATSIPELLRMVPGVEVARIDASKWAITARGFNGGRFSNKLLVLFDGMSIYNPLFSGVLWDQWNYILEDIERIEVIRGPGASMWGANAVNGVINIITKRARDTQGGLVAGAYGDHERIGAARYGGKIDNSTYYRAFSKYYDHSGFPSAQDTERDDGWNYNTSGFRIDRDLSSRDALTMEGQFLNDNTSETYLTPSLTTPYLDRTDATDHVIGGTAMARWNRTLSASSNFQLQTYYIGGSRYDPLLDTFQNTFDIEFQHQFKLWDRQSLLWGLSYRLETDNSKGSSAFELNPYHENNLFSAFLQDEVKFLDDSLILTLGSRLEHNDHTGFEVQPNARLLWTPYKRHSLWAAVSRAVRTPSWSEEDGQMVVSSLAPGTYSPFPILVKFNGSKDFDSEELNAFELGYRFMPSDKLSIDITGFWNLYDNLRSEETGTVSFEASPVPHFVVPLTAANKLDGSTYGAELAVDWQPLKWWRIQTAYTYLQLDLSADKGSNDKASVYIISDSNPHHQLSVRSWIDLPYHMQFDTWLRYVDALPSLNVDSYVTMDARLAWKPMKNLEISIVGQNLLEAQHVEATSDFLGTIQSEIERSIYGKVVWRF